MNNDELCTICDKSLLDNVGEIDFVQVKGLKTAIARSQKLNDDKWKLWLHQSGVFFHRSCRNRYVFPTKKRKLANLLEANDASSVIKIESPSEFDNSSQECFLYDNNGDKICTICEEPLENDADEIITVQQGELSSAIAKSQQLEDGKWKLWVGQSSASFHENCRNRYIYDYCAEAKAPHSPPVEIEDLLPVPKLENLESCDFDFSQSCYICGEPLARQSNKVHNVRNYNVDRLISAAMGKAHGEAENVVRRLMYVQAHDSITASYHYKCYVSFYVASPDSGKQRVKEVGEVDEDIRNICDFIEQSGNCRFTLTELKAVMNECQVNDAILCTKLKEHYGPKINVLQYSDEQTIIYYKTFNVMKVCKDWLRNDGAISDFEKQSVLTLAAKILRTEIERSEYKSCFPESLSNFEDNVKSEVPPVLSNFLRDLLADSNNGNGNFVKRQSIAHSILAVIRPNSYMSVLQTAIGAYAYKMTGSKSVVNLFYGLGMSPSFYKLQINKLLRGTSSRNIELENALTRFVCNKGNSDVQHSDEELD